MNKNALHWYMQLDIKTTEDWCRCNRVRDGAKISQGCKVGNTAVCLIIVPRCSSCRLEIALRFSGAPFIVSICCRVGHASDGDCCHSDMFSQFSSSSRVKQKLGQSSWNLDRRQELTVLSNEECRNFYVGDVKFSRG